MCTSIEEEQNKLRAERNALQLQMNEIQKRIDELELSRHDADKYINQIVKIVSSNGTMIMFVQEIRRLVYGVRFYGQMLRSDNYPTNTNISISDYDDITVSWEGIDKHVSILSDKEAGSLAVELLSSNNCFNKLWSCYNS